MLDEEVPVGPYYKEDLPMLDRLHYSAGLGPEWMDSAERALLDRLPKPPEGHLVCAYPGRCTQSIPNNSWAKTKSGFFERKDGQVFCPDHIPAWVKEWREKKRRSSGR